MDTYQSAKDDIKRAADIVELIGQHVQLRKAGLNHVGLCPFHSDKDPSFSVSPSKQMFHCFGCKKGGDIFDFWMEYHKVSFRQALGDLADRYHVSLPQKKLSPLQKKKIELNERLYEINRTAVEYYCHILERSERGKPGREYFTRRNIDQEVRKEYFLGYATAEWDGLIRYLEKKKVDFKDAEQAGLIIPKKNNGYYDRFRGRVIFPIINIRNQVVGFGGRVLDDSLPKYLNTPETPIFHKGKLLYGMHTAFQSIREKNRAVIVEGYTDVLALRKKGFREAVATLGTALSGDHIRQLKGYTKEVVVVFDSDAAGKGAAMKSMPLFLNEGLSSKVMILPEGEDPDSFVNENGLEEFSRRLKKSMPMFDFYLDNKLSNQSISIENQVGLLNEIVPVLADLKNDTQRLLYIRHLSEKTGIRESIILSELRNRKISSDGPKQNSGLRNKISALKVKRSDDFPLLNLLIHSPDSIQRLMDCDCGVLIDDPVIREIYDSICKVHKVKETVTPDTILQELENEAAKGKLREVTLSPPIYPEETVDQAVKEFEKSILKIKLAESLKKAREQGDIHQLNLLLKAKSGEQG